MTVYVLIPIEAIAEPGISRKSTVERTRRMLFSAIRTADRLRWPKDRDNSRPEPPTPPPLLDCDLASLQLIA